jgi:hypothetical protein
MRKSIRDIEAINLQREYTLNADTETLIEVIQKQTTRSDSFMLQVDSADKSEFRLQSKFSYGVGMMDEFQIGFWPITLYCRVQTLGLKKTRLMVKTKTRIEVIVLAVLVVLASFGIILSDEQAPVWLYFLFAGCVLWFQMIYRWQEKGLLEELEKVTGKPDKKKT